MATTALVSVNNVLKSLRENPVTSTTFATSPYAQQLLQFLNQTRQEASDAWDWTIHRQTITINTIVGVNAYSIVGAGQRWRFYDKRKIILNATNRTLLIPANSGWMEEAKTTFTTNNTQPIWYRFIGQDANSDPIIEFYPTPDKVYVLKVPLVVPGADLVLFSDTYNLQPLMIEMGTWARAISERGEDGGVDTSEQRLMYKSFLADAIANDAGRVADELVWTTQ